VNNDIVTVTTTIEGLSPGILMHRWAEESEEQKPSRSIHVDRGTAREQAAKTAYTTEAGELYLPTTAFSTPLKTAGRRHKQPGSRQSMMYIVPAAVIMTEDIALLHNESNAPIITWEVDSRPVTIPATKGRIMRHRCKVERWRSTFSFEVDTDVLGVNMIHQLLEEGGRRIGILDYRPERGGPYGRFHVINWQES
jgi:hypothetical protein